MTVRNELDNARFIEIGYNIQYYRKHKGLTQEDLAEKLGISRQHLGAIEAPRIIRPISMDLLFNIADALEVDPKDLLDFHQYNITKKEKHEK